MGLLSGLFKKPDHEAAIQSQANYSDVVPGFRTGTSATDAQRPGRPVMRNVPTTVVAPTHQKYDSAPFTGGEVLQYDYTPYQLQPTNQQIRQYGYPKPGIDMYPPDATYRIDDDFPSNVNNRVEAPFAINNLPKNIAPRPSELIQDFGKPNYRPPLSYWLSQKTPVGQNPEMQFAHKLQSGLTPYAPARDYPRSYNGWTHREYFSGPNAPAQIERDVIKAGAPPQLQVSPGGLTIDSFKLVQKNLNINLAELYKGATAPVSASYSGKCP